MNKLLLIALVSFSFLLLFGCPGKESESPAPTTPSEEGPKITIGGYVAETEPVEEVPVEEDWNAKALETRDTSYCFKLPTYERDGCVYPLSNDSLSNCLQLIQYEYKRECLFYHAYETENITLCDLMSDEDKAVCLEELSPPCAFVTEPVARGRCLAFEYQNYTYCEDEDCYLDFAMEYRDVGACEGLPYAKAQGCKSGITYIDYCKGEANEVSYSHQCYQYYAIVSDNPSYCYNIKTKENKYESEIAYECFTYFAIKDDNPDLCSAIIVTKQWDCLTDYALGTKNKEGCYLIDPLASFSRENCFKEFAYTYDDVSACNEIGTEYVRQICYSALIFTAETLEISECNSILLPEWRDKCYSEYARLEDDIVFCNYIESEAVKVNCQNQFTEYE